MTKTNTVEMGRIASSMLDGASICGLDVGARGDIPATWLPLDGVAAFVCVEPDTAACTRLRETYDRRGNGHMYTILPVALAGSNGERRLYLTHTRGGSSFFNPDNPVSKAYSDWDYLFPIELATLVTRSPGDVLAEARIDRIDFAKLDIQGAELEVLQALPDARMASLLCVEMEAALQRKATDYPTFCDVHQFMLSKGLELFDVHTSRRHRAKDGRRLGYVTEDLGAHGNSPSVSARIYEFDTLYLRTCESVIAGGNVEALRKLITCFCLYGFFAEALHAVEAGHVSKLLTDRAGEQLRSAILRWHAVARMRRRWRSGRLWDLVRWPLKYLNLEERPVWWPYY